jgi:HEAT repeat protein
MTRRHAAYALSAIGASAVDALVEALQSANPLTRADAATVLGDIGYATNPAIDALIDTTKDAETSVRQRAAEALGILGRSPAPVPALIDALADSEVSVRTAAAFALCRLGPQAAEAVSALEHVLDDENRYVRGDALFALQRIDTAEAKDTLIKHLMPARWCPLTTRESTF